MVAGAVVATFAAAPLQAQNGTTTTGDTMVTTTTTQHQEEEHHFPWGLLGLLGLAGLLKRPKEREVVTRPVERTTRPAEIHVRPTTDPDVTDRTVIMDDPQDPSSGRTRP